MNAMRILLGTLLLLAVSAVPMTANANPCATGCAELRVEACVGSFATGSSTLSTTWTLTYRHPGGTITQTTTGFAPPPAAAGGECWIPGCYYGTLTNGFGLHLSDGICIE